MKDKVVQLQCIKMTLILLLVQKIKNGESLLFGASYATSEVEIFKDKILSWDRGYDSDDKSFKIG